MGRKPKALTTIETTPEHLRGFGGDAGLEIPRHVDPVAIVNKPITLLTAGDIVLKAAPETQLVFALLDDRAGNVESMKSRVHARVDGWSECMADDFYLSEQAQLVFGRDAAGRLTMGGDSVNAIVLYCRSKERHDLAAEAVRESTRDVAKSAEEKMAELGQQLVYAGMIPSYTVETFDKNENLIDRRESNFTTKTL